MFDLSRLFFGAAHAQTMTETTFDTAVASGANPNVKYMIAAVLAGLVYFLFFHKKKSK